MGARPVEPQDRQAHHCRRRRTAHVGPRGDGLELHEANLLQAVEWLQGGARRMGEWYARGFDLLLSPTIAEPPPLLGEFVQRPDNPLQAIFRAASIVPFTPPYNATGQPAVSLRSTRDLAAARPLAYGSSPRAKLVDLDLPLAPRALDDLSRALNVAVPFGLEATPGSSALSLHLGQDLPAYPDRCIGQERERDGIARPGVHDRLPLRTL